MRPTSYQRDSHYARGTSEFVKVTDINAIMAYDLLSTPGLVIDERLVSSGRVPTLAEMKKWIAA